MIIFRKMLFCTLLMSPLILMAQTSPPPAEESQMSERIQQKMLRADSNNDGEISKAEYMADAEKKFSRIDTDKDGKISKAEMQAMAKYAKKVAQSTQFP